MMNNAVLFHSDFKFKDQESKCSLDPALFLVSAVKLTAFSNRSWHKVCYSLHDFHAVSLKCWHGDADERPRTVALPVYDTAV